MLSGPERGLIERGAAHDLLRRADEILKKANEGTINEVIQMTETIRAARSTSLSATDASAPPSVHGRFQPAGANHVAHRRRRGDDLNLSRSLRRD